MITSTEEPKEIVIINSRDDIKNGKTKVSFAFRYSIQQTTIDQTSIDEETGEEVVTQVQGWQYKEYISEQEFDLFLKPIIPDILKSMYISVKPQLEALGDYSDFELPREFNAQ